MPDVTVAICTAGERSTLRGTLRSLLAQEFAASVNFELLVVDNSRADSGFVERVIAEASREGGLPVRHVRESRVGLGFARNAAIAAAAGEIVAFVDDDVVVDRAWISELVRAYRETGAAVVGGRIEPLWGSARPDWLRDDLLGYLSLLDYGPERRECRYPRYPFGANISFRHDLLVQLGGFTTTLGGGGAPTYLMDEIELCRRVERAGKRIVYAPTVKVQHIVPASRLTRGFFLHRAAILGRATVRMGLAAGATPISTWASGKGLLLAGSRVVRHGARAFLFAVAGRDGEVLSESRHVVWNLAWMWETALVLARST